MIQSPSRQTTLADRADVRLPTDTRALVIFVHGSGSGRSSPRNQYVADALAQRGLV